MPDRSRPGRSTPGSCDLRIPEMQLLQLAAVGAALLSQQFPSVATNVYALQDEFVAHADSQVSAVWPVIGIPARFDPLRSKCPWPSARPETTSQFGVARGAKLLRKQ